MSKENWERIYHRGEQMNRYPYEFVVSAFFHYAQAEQRPIKVLDVGCGAGNHTLFCAENNCDVVAIDYSASALKEVQRRAKEAGLTDKVKTVQLDLEQFELQDNEFDLVIDRLSITNLPSAKAKMLIQHIHKLMNPGGVFLSCLYSSNHQHKNFGHYSEAQNLWTNFTDGVFEPLLNCNFFTQTQIAQMFSDFTLISLVEEYNRDLLVSGADTGLWKIIAQKK